MSERLAAFLVPQSIALVGCPGDLTRPGARPLVYLTRHAYPGRIYPVNPRYDSIGGLKAYPSLDALPERPDTVWVGVPGTEVEAVLREMVRLGIKNAVVLTAGFGETDAAGKARQAALTRLAEEGGITLLGPNMLGFINCWDRVPLTFSPAGGIERLRPGPLGIASQSGAIGGIVVNRAFDRMLGVSVMISTGNEAGVTVSECLEYFAADARTQAVALVAEGIRDGARFRAGAARLLEAGKPLVALRVGHSVAGRRNALTHTGALTGSRESWRAVARQLGIVEAETIEDLVDVAGFLSRERRPISGGIGVVASSGGASIMTADQIEGRGLRLPRLSAATVSRLGALLPPYAVTRDNPVDVTAGLSEAVFAEVLASIARDPALDAVVATVTGARGVERAENIARAAAEASKPVVACWVSGSLTDAGVPVLDGHGVACFRNPRTLAQALGAARDSRAARAAWSARRPIVARPIAEAPRSYRALAEAARRAGVALVPQALVDGPEAAARAARRLGFPVALKVVAADLAHKTDAGALALGLPDAAAVSRAARAMLRRAGALRVEGLLVQRMVSGIEVLVGVAADATFGPLLVIGAGGVLAELLGDTTARPLPVAPSEIRTMLGEVRALAALAGYRGAPPADVPALIKTVCGVARLALGLGERLVSLDANPVIVGPRGRGAVAVDLLAVLKD